MGKTSDDQRVPAANSAAPPQISPLTRAVRIGLGSLILAVGTSLLWGGFVAEAGAPMLLGLMASLLGVAVTTGPHRVRPGTAGGDAPPVSLDQYYARVGVGIGAFRARMRGWD
ncbi:hypothetical protein RSP03_44540 [Cereibacter sphaeroides]|jgi:hypothetical protein|nr:hypothetical protein RSP03_44540 [Cereibacter sphaeroides]